MNGVIFFVLVWLYAVGALAYVLALAGLDRPKVKPHPWRRRLGIAFWPLMVSCWVFLIFMASLGHKHHEPEAPAQVVSIHRQRTGRL
jgi:hypothetical protein